MKFRAALLLGLFATLPAHAGLFSDDEARQQVAELRKTVDALSKRIDSAAQNQLDFANQAEALRTAMARLTGQVEVLTNSLESAHKRQQDFYVDLDNRLRKLEGTSSPEAGTTPSTTGESKSDPQAEMREYEAALSLSSAGKFKEAQAAFQAFITAHPKSPQLPSANYWLGHSLYQQKLYCSVGQGVRPCRGNLAERRQGAGRHARAGQCAGQRTGCQRRHTSAGNSGGKISDQPGRRNRALAS